ncbi:MAG: hypothetical protein ABIO86_04990 [Sphingomonas sp.]
MFDALFAALLLTYAQRSRPLSWEVLNAAEYTEVQRTNIAPILA